MTVPDGGPTDSGPIQIDAGSPPAQTCAEVDRTVEADPPPRDANVTLSGVYRITDRYIYDAGQTVTIEPGTIFLMGPDARLYFGFRNDPATVFANGTAEAPILFCGTMARQGHWQDLQLLGGTTTDSYLEHVRFEDAGGGEASDSPAALVSTNALRLSNVTVTNSRNTGMELSGLAADSEALTVTGNDALALRLLSASSVTNLPPGEYTGNTRDYAEVDRFGGGAQVVFHDRGIPYRQLNRRIIFNVVESSMTLEAGVEYQFCQDCLLVIGFGNGPGSLFVNGTEADPVVFTSSRDTPSPGDWNGLVLDSGSTSATLIDHAELRYGGKTGAGNLIIEGGSGTVRNSLFADSAGAGIFIDGRAASALNIEASNAFERNAGGDVVP